MSNSVVEGLKKVLADTYMLYLKTHNYHWNVEGVHFKLLHELFEEQYIDLATAIDETAELIRSAGEKAPGTWQAYDQVTVIGPGDENFSAQEMVRDLIGDQEKITGTLSAALKEAQQVSDEVVIGALVDRMTVHRKNKWMLESSLAH